MPDSRPPNSESRVGDPQQNVQNPRSTIQGPGSRVRSQRHPDPESEIWIQNPKSGSGDPDPNSTVQNQRSKVQNPRIEGSRSRSRIWDSEPYLRHKKHGARIQFLHSRPQFQVPGSRLLVLSIDFFWFGALALLPPLPLGTVPSREFFLIDSDKSVNLINAH